MKNNFGSTLISLLTSLGVGATLIVSALAIYAKSVQTVSRLSRTDRARDLAIEIKKDILNDVRNQLVGEMPYTFAEPPRLKVFQSSGIGSFYCHHFSHNCFMEPDCRRVGSLPGECGGFMEIFQHGRNFGEFKKVIYETICIDGVQAKNSPDPEILVHPELKCSEGKSRVVRKYWPSVEVRFQYEEKFYEVEKGMPAALCFRPCTNALVEFNVLVRQAVGPPRIEKSFFSLLEGRGIPAVEFLPPGSK